MDIVSLEFGDLDVIAGELQEQLPPIININKETRWGGEEFIAVFEGVGLEDAADLAENLRALFAQHHFDSIGTITSSFGVVEVYENETSKDALSRVDSALYKAKELGRNRVVKG